MCSLCQSRSAGSCTCSSRAGRGRLEDGKNSEGWRGRDLKGGVHLYMAIDRGRLTGHGSGKRAVARGREQSTWDSVWQGREGGGISTLY